MYEYEKPGIFLKLWNLRRRLVGRGLKINTAKKITNIKRNISALIRKVRALFKVKSSFHNNMMKFNENCIISIHLSKNSDEFLSLNSFRYLYNNIHVTFKTKNL